MDTEDQEELHDLHVAVWNDEIGTDIGNPILFPDMLEGELRSDGGPFAWHMNPSTRPIVAGRFGREPAGSPQATISLANPPGIPAVNQEGDYQAGAYESIPFTVSGPPAVDNGRMTVHIEWGNPAVDWDLYVVNATGEVVTQSASFGDATEDAVLVDPPPGQYTAHVVNFDGGETSDWTLGEVRFLSPTPTVYGPKEAWQLTCEDEEGRVRAMRNLVVERGERVNVGRVCSSAAIAVAKRR